MMPSSILPSGVFTGPGRHCMIFPRLAWVALAVRAGPSLLRSPTFIPGLRLLSSVNMDASTQGKPMQVISEGTAHMHYDPKETVFYNKVQVFNRDLSIQVIKLYSEKVREEKLARLEKKKANKLSQGLDGAALDNIEQAMANVDHGITILDALAASGLRSIRYLKEIPNVKHLTINDLSSTATDLAMDNCQRNQVDQSKVIISNQDATILMYNHRDPAQRFDVIDLDPYGSATPFLDGAVQAVANGGLLCVTCTDMTALAGAFPEVCFAKYQAMPVKAKFGHELGLRILLHAIDCTANKYKRHIVPWLSLSVDFYVRVFVRVYESAAEVKRSCLKRAVVLQSCQSPSFYVHPLTTRRFNRALRTEGKKKKLQQQAKDAKAQDQDEAQDQDKAQGAAVEEEHERVGTDAAQEPDHSQQMVMVGGTFGASILRVPSHCEETGGNLRLGGPFWSEPIHDQAIVDELLARVNAYLETERDPSVPETHPIPTAKRLGGVLSSLSEELKDVCLHYHLPDLASAAQISVPTLAEFRAALLSAGYRFSQFHHDPNAVKTDAPNKVVWDIIRAYAKLHPPTFSAKRGQSDVSKKILAHEVSTQVDFTHEKRVTKGLARFPPNPEAHWGPKRRAGKAGRVGEDDGAVAEMEVEAVDEPDQKRPKA